MKVVTQKRTTKFLKKKGIEAVVPEVKKGNIGKGKITKRRKSER